MNSIYTYFLPYLEDIEPRWRLLRPYPNIKHIETGACHTNGQTTCISLKHFTS